MSFGLPSLRDKPSLVSICTIFPGKEPGPESLFEDPQHHLSVSSLRRYPLLPLNQGKAKNGATSYLETHQFLRFSLFCPFWGTPLLQTPPIGFLRSPFVFSWIFRISASQAGGLHLGADQSVEEGLLHRELQAGLSRCNLSRVPLENDPGCMNRFAW